MGEVELLSTLLSARFDHALTRFTGVNETTNRHGGQGEVNASVTLSALVSFQKETDMNHPELLLMNCTDGLGNRVAGLMPFQCTTIVHCPSSTKGDSTNKH